MMSRTRCRPGVGSLSAATYVVAMVAGGLFADAQGSPSGGLLLWLSQPGLNVLYALVLMPLSAMFGDVGGESGDAGSVALACGLGAVMNVLLLRTAVCFARMVAADLPACRKRRTPTR